MTVTTNRSKPENVEELSEAPLSDVKVLDLSRVLAGPYAAMMLGDLGAEVIKVEREGSGDDTRLWGPPFVGPDGRTESTYFLSVNRNKRSVVLDLKRAEDLTVLTRLIETSDVLIENFRHGVMERLGFGDDRLLEINPRLIVLSITGFGHIGPDRERTGYDQILQAEGGLMSFTGPDSEPTKVGVPLADLIAGMVGVSGVLAALHERERSGRGQIVRTSLLAGQIATHCFQGTRWLIAGEVPEPSGNHHPVVCPYGVFATGDGRVVIAVGNDAIWRRFAPVLHIDADDARFVTNSKRIANRDALHKLIETGLRTDTTGAWLARLTAVGVPVGEVKTLDRVYESPQVEALGLKITVAHPSLGLIDLPGSPLAFSRSSEVEHMPPPRLGEHTDEIKSQAARTNL